MVANTLSGLRCVVFDVRVLVASIAKSGKPLCHVRLMYVLLMHFCNMPLCICKCSDKNDCSRWSCWCTWHNGYLKVASIVASVHKSKSNSFTQCYSSDWCPNLPAFARECLQNNVAKAVSYSQTEIPISLFCVQGTVPPLWQEVLRACSGAAYTPLRQHQSQALFPECKKWEGRLPSWKKEVRETSAKNYLSNENTPVQVEELTLFIDHGWPLPAWPVWGVVNKNKTAKGGVNNKIGV